MSDKTKIKFDLQKVHDYFHDSVNKVSEDDVRLEPYLNGYKELYKYELKCIKLSFIFLLIYKKNYL